MAVDRNPDVMEMVERAIREDPDVSNDELQERAAEIDASVGDLSPRSFHARYPLQVKRRMSAERKEEKGERGDEDAGRAAERDELRGAVRRSLIDFARDVAGAEDRGKVIDVLTRVDEYVDRAVKQS